MFFKLLLIVYNSLYFKLFCLKLSYPVKLFKNIQFIVFIHYILPNLSKPHLFYMPICLCSTYINPKNLTYSIFLFFHIYLPNSKNLTYSKFHLY